MKKRSNKRANIIRVGYGVAMAALTAVFFYCAGSLAVYYQEAAKTEELYSSLNEIVVNAGSSLNGGVGNNGSDTPNRVDPVTELVTITDPKTGQEMQILYDYAELYLMNTDLVGWIKIDGTSINYPVVQKKDKTDYYLKRDFNGDYNSRGCIYVREQCDVFAPSDNVTIYGHRMKDGSMFADLANFTKKEFWQENRYIQFDTLTERHTYEIIAVVKTTATLGQGFSYHKFVNADNASEFNEFVHTCKQLDYFDTGLDAQYGDKLITLSTCDRSITNGRLVVVARRITETTPQTEATEGLTG